MGWNKQLSSQQALPAITQARNTDGITNSEQMKLFCMPSHNPTYSPCFQTKSSENSCFCSLLVPHMPFGTFSYSNNYSKRVFIRLQAFLHTCIVNCVDCSIKAVGTPHKITFNKALSTSTFSYHLWSAQPHKSQQNQNNLGWSTTVGS